MEEKQSDRGKMNSSMPGNGYDPVMVSRQLRINADIIMDEISAHVDKELDRFGECIQHMKKQATKHMETIQQPGYFE